MNCPKCGSEMLPIIEPDFPGLINSTYHETGGWWCKCGHEKKVSDPSASRSPGARAHARVRVRGNKGGT